MQRFTVLTAFLVAAGVAQAVAPEAAYWAARDRAIAQLKALENGKAAEAKLQAIETAALADLGKKLVALVGPVKIAGFADAKSNLETLRNEVGFGKLDGLALAPTQGDKDGATLVATTRTLLDKWLQARGAESDAALRVPAKIEAAFHSDNFYTFAVGSDAAFSRAVDLDIAKPAGAEFAAAALGRWSQDEGASPLDRVMVAVASGGRVRIADVAAATKVEIAVCKSGWEAALAKAEKLSADYQTGGAKDEKLLEVSEKARTDGSTAWLACVGEKGKSAPSYPALKGQAQALAERLAGG